MLLEHIEAIFIIIQQLKIIRANVIMIAYSC